MRKMKRLAWKYQKGGEVWEPAVEKYLHERMTLWRGREEKRVPSNEHASRMRIRSRPEIKIEKKVDGARERDEYVSRDTRNRRVLKF